MTPTMSMKPSARRPKRTPSATPLTMWGSKFMAPLRFVNRSRLERLQLAFGFGLRVEDLVRGGVAQDLEEVVWIVRLEVGRGQVDRLLQLVGFRVHPRVVVLHADARGDLELLELLDHTPVAGGLDPFDRLEQSAGRPIA